MGKHDKQVVQFGSGFNLVKLNFRNGVRFEYKLGSHEVQFWVSFELTMLKSDTDLVRLKFGVGSIWGGANIYVRSVCVMYVSCQR